MSLSVFKPEDLVSIKVLCQEGAIPKSWRTVRELCRKKKFPAVKDGRDWKTTRVAVKSFFWKTSNPAFRRISA